MRNFAKKAEIFAIFRKIVAYFFSNFFLANLIYAKKSLISSKVFEILSKVFKILKKIFENFAKVFVC